ncbi:alpha/beta fold hydrolase [Dactylosporangium sp. CA-233914]|uniref:alpha/beta fold hydrolase n=1 Tax=Dactylosporangium sp. CA-233914 TaxID=3239934 RepID=UPI003D91D7DC
MSSLSGRVEPAFEQHGRGGPPLVLLHGLANSRAVWREVLPALAADRVVLAYDHRGHGDSPHLGRADAYTLDALGADLAGLLQARGMTRVDLAGHSLGGTVALRFTLRRPELVRSLILVEPVTRAPGDLPRAVADRLLARAGTEGMAGIAALLDRIADFAPRPRSPARRRRLRDSVARMDPAAFAGLTAALESLPAMDDALRALDVATSVICGDDPAARSRAGHLERTMPRTVVRIVPGAGHAPHEDDPAGWLAAVHAHFADLRREGPEHGQNPDRQRVQRGPSRAR